MNVTLCALNSKYIHSSLSLWCIYAACGEGLPDEVKVTPFEGTVNENEAAFFDRLMQMKPDAVAFSCYIWNIERVLSLCEKIKALKPDVLVILGGPEVAYRQRDVLTNHAFVDFVLSGEGEAVLPPLLKRLIHGDCLTDLPGVSYKKGDGVHIGVQAESTNFDFPSPYCDEYFASLGGRITYFESSRGCPFSCAYCLSGRQGRVRFKSMDKVKSELLLLSKSGTKTVKFVDRTFNCSNARAVEILRFIFENYGKEIPSGVCFHFEISADILSEEFMGIVERMPTGAVQFEVGIQSWNEETLRAIGRKTDLDKLSSNVRRLISFGNCHIHTDLIAGLPFETHESFVDGFNKSYALGGNMLQLGFLKLLYGSPMRENSSAFPCEYGDRPPYEVRRTPWLSAESLTELHKVEAQLDALYNSGRFNLTLKFVLEKSGLSPYELFLFVSGKMAADGEKSLPLDVYTDRIFEVLGALDGVDRGVLRDRMLSDRIETNNSGVIPKSLQVKDTLVKRVKHVLSLLDPASKGVNRSVGILYESGEVIYCDYGEKNAVTGRYKARILPLDVILKENKENFQN